MLRWPFLLADRCITSSGRRMAAAGGYAPYWLVRRVAEAKLAHTLKHVWRHCPPQRARWEKAGIRRRHLNSPRVLHDIPFCDPNELAETPEAFFCVPPETFTDVTCSSGTTGKPKKIYFTPDDLDRQACMMGAYLRRLPGASRVLVLLGLLGGPAATTALIAKRGVEKAGMFGLINGSHFPTEKHVGLIREYGFDTVICTPTRLHKITLEAEGDLRALGVKYFLLVTEPWGETLRATLESAWGAKALDVYGANEAATGIASECAYQTGLHVAEINQWIEIVDPKTGQPLPDGEEGEVVFTTLSRRGMPLVRYRIGDLAKLHPAGERCACGMNLKKLSRIRGRLDKMVIIGSGYNVYPDEFDEVILRIPGVTDYQLTIEKDAYLDVLHLDVETDLEGDVLTETMTRALMSIPFVRSGVDEYHALAIRRIRRVPRGSLCDGRSKTVRIMDNRNQTED